MPDQLHPQAIKDIIERYINHRGRGGKEITQTNVSGKRSIIMYDMTFA